MAETVPKRFNKKISRPILPLLSRTLPMYRGVAGELRGTDTNKTPVLAKKVEAPVTRFTGSDTINLFPPGKEEKDPRFEKVEFDVRVFDPRQVPIPWPVVDIMFGDRDVTTLNKGNQVLNPKQPERKYESLPEGADRIRLIFTTFTLRAAAGFGDNLEGARPLSHDSAIMLASMPLKEATSAPATLD